MNENLVTLPLSPTDMVEFFKDKSQVYTVDYDVTVENLSPRSMLMYLANLGINCSFSRVTHELMTDYITMKEFSNTPVLAAIHANILGYIKFETIMYPEVLPLFGVSAIVKFAQEHVDIVADQCTFLDSFYLYMETRALGEDDEVTQTELFDDELHDAISFSLVTLLQFEDFMINWMAEVPPLDEQTYYSRYFDDYMFRGKNLFFYAHQSSAFGLFSILQNAQENEDAKKEMDALDAFMTKASEQLGAEDGVSA